MLKRHGERCEFEVPESSGRLTASEHAAYAEAIASIEDQLRHFTEAATAMTEIEKQIPQWSEWITTEGTERLQFVEIQGRPGTPWQIRHTLLRRSRTELLFCSRESEQGLEFGIMEKIKSDLPNTQTNEICEVRLTSNNPRLLLQDYLDNLRRSLSVFKKDIEAAAERTLSEKFPNQNLSQVVKAISRKCDRQIVPGDQNLQTQTLRRGMRIRL